MSWATPQSHIEGVISSWNLRCPFKRLFLSLSGHQCLANTSCGRPAAVHLQLYQHTELMHPWTRPGFFPPLSLNGFSDITQHNHPSIPTSLGLQISSELCWGCSDIFTSHNVNQFFPPMVLAAVPECMRPASKPQGKSSGWGPLKAKIDKKQGRGPQTGKGGLRGPADHR